MNVLQCVLIKLYKLWISSKQIWTFSSLSQPPSSPAIVQSPCVRFWASKMMPQVVEWTNNQRTFMTLLSTFSVTLCSNCHLNLENPITSFDHFGATDSRDDTTDSAQWADLQRRSLWWPEFDGWSPLSCTEMENSVWQHIYDQTVPHYTASLKRSLLFIYFS